MSNITIKRLIGYPVGAVLAFSVGTLLWEAIREMHTGQLMQSWWLCIIIGAFICCGLLAVLTQQCGPDYNQIIADEKARQQQFIDDHDRFMEALQGYEIVGQDGRVTRVRRNGLV